jgi:hypothetical protein
MAAGHAARRSSGRWDVGVRARGQGADAAAPDWFRTALLLFIGLRLVLLMALPAETLFQYGDYEHHYNLALWSVAGHCPAGPAPCWPMVDYWYEFPPVFGLITLGLVRLLGGGAPPLHVFAYALALLLFTVDLGNLVLLRRIAQRLYSAATADWIAVVYAVLPAPLVVSLWSFDGLTTLWTLLGLWALLAGRDGLSAAATGLGVLTKIFPGLLLPAVWRARPWRRAAVYTAGVAAVVGLGLAPFLIRAPAMTLASLRSQVSKSSYATVWAMVDGNLWSADGQPLTGNFGPLLDRFDPALALVPLHQPARVPGWLTLAAAGLAVGGVWLGSWRSARPWGARQTVQLTAFTWAAYMLWSRGWSPQWQIMLIPLMLLTMPNRSGVLLTLVLAAVSFLEWPVLLTRGLAWGYLITIPLRTALIAGWAIYLARELLPARLRVPAEASA